MTVQHCAFQHGRPAFGPSCTEFVYPECWHLDFDVDDATSNIYDVIIVHQVSTYPTYDVLLSSPGPKPLAQKPKNPKTQNQGA